MTNERDDNNIVSFAEFCERIRAVARGEAPPPAWAGRHCFASEQARQEWETKRMTGKVVKSLFDSHELEWVDLYAWPQLRDLAGSRHDRWFAGAEALALYEHVDESRLTPTERALFEALKWRYGGAGREGSDGQP